MSHLCMFNWSFKGEWPLANRDFAIANIPKEYTLRDPYDYKTSSSEAWTSGVCEYGSYDP